MAFRSTALIGLGLAALALAGCGHDDKRAAMKLTEAPQFGLYFNDNGETASLAYGEANSDNVALMLECGKGSGRVQVSDIARGEAPAALVLASGRKTSALRARLEASDGGPAILTADAPLAGDALQGFRKTGRLVVSQGEDALRRRRRARPSAPRSTCSSRPAARRPRSRAARAGSSRPGSRRPGASRRPGRRRSA